MSLGPGTPPHDRDAEVSVMGAVLREPQCFHEVVACGLRPDDFYERRWQLTWEAALSLYAEGQTPDAVTICARLRERGEAEDAGAPDSLTDAWAQVQSAANLPHYVRIVRDKAMLRRLIATCREGQALGFAGEGKPGEIVDRVSHQVFEIALDAGQKRPEPVALSVRAVLEEIDERVAAQGAPPGLRSPWPDLDDYTNGFQPGQVIVIAARPSVGKSSAASNIALGAALRDDVPVLIFSLETLRKQVAMNMLCMLASVEVGDVNRGWVATNEAALERLNEAAVRLSKAKIFVDDTAGLDLLQFRAKSRQMVHREKVGLIVVDYVQLMIGKPDAENKQAELESISRAIKNVASDLNVPVLAVAQLNREVEQREKPKPRLSDLRGSGAWEQDADVVIMIYRPDYYEDKSAGTEKDVVDAHFMVVKNRIGKTGEVKLQFRKRFMRFDQEDPFAEDPDPRPGKDGD